MSRKSFTIIDEQRTHDVQADLEGECVRFDPDTLARTLGWKLEDRGLCRGGVCVPVAGVPGLVTDRGVALDELAGLLDRPLAVDHEHRVAALAAPAADRASTLARLTAPDFRLPDLQGRLHSLSEHRGKKVLLLAHASW
jgi:hypothetical protein